MPSWNEDTCERAARDAERRDTTQGCYGAQGFFDALGMFEQARFLFQFLLFVFLEVGGAEFVVEE